MKIYQENPESLKSAFTEVVCCVKSRTGKILLLMNPRDYEWDFPKGRVKENEDVKVAFLRVLREAIGLPTLRSQVTEVKKFFCKPRYYGGIFDCHVWTLVLDEQEIKTNAPYTDHIWLSSPEAICSLITQLHLRRFVKLILS